jgi:hypothetical protein
VGGLMASLDPYHLGLVLAVLRHAGSGSESTRNSTVPRPEGIGRSSEGVVLIALGPMRATRTGIDSRSVGAPVAVSTDRK